MKTNLPLNRSVKMYRLFFIAALALCSFNSTAADYYWVGNSGYWSDLSHWANSSGGTTMQTQLPTANDDVFFDANSFTLPGQGVHFDQMSMYAHSMNWTGALNSPACDGVFSYNMFISGSLTFVAAMNMNFAGGFIFSATTTGQTIISAGQHFVGTITFNGAGGEWTLQDALTVTSGIILYTGTLNTNDQTVTIAFVNVGYSLPGTLNMGASVFNITGVSAWLGGNGSITVNSGTSVINCSYHGAQFIGSSPTASTFYDVNFSDSADVYGTSNFHNVTFHANGNLQNSNVFNNLNFSAGYSYKLFNATTQTINGSLNANGTCSSLITIQTDGTYSTTTINHASGAINVSYVLLYGIHASGTAIFTATNSIDINYNTGWIFTTVPDDLYWVDNTGTWNDGNHWSNTSGGPPQVVIHLPGRMCILMQILFLHRARPLR